MIFRLMKNYNKYGDSWKVYEIAEPIFKLKFYDYDDIGYFHWLGQIINNYRDVLCNITYVCYYKDAEYRHNYIFEDYTKTNLKEDVDIDNNKIESFLMKLGDYIYSSKCEITENQKDKMNFIIMRELKRIK